MELKASGCMKCGAPVLFDPPYVCENCGFNNEPWFEGGLPVVIFALTYKTAADFAEMRGMTPGRWFYLDSVERLFGLKRALIWRVGNYYLRNDLLVVEQYISTHDFTYIEAPIQTQKQKRGKEA